MHRETARNIVIGLYCVALAACGGGGGGNGDGPVIQPPTPTLPAVLEFDQPSRFANGEPHVTGSSSTELRGGLRSAYVPGGFCPDNDPPQNYRIEWLNTATGQSGSTPIQMVCVTTPLPGIVTVFVIESVALNPGNNTLEFETFAGSTRIGRDSVRIVLEDRFAPRVLDSYPADGQQDVAPNHALVVLFSEPMNESSLTSDRFLVTDGAGAAVAGQAGYDAGTRAWTFRPDAMLAASGQYSLTISGDVVDAGGNNPLGTDFTVSFATGTTDDNVTPAVVREWPGTNCDCAPATTRIIAGLDEFIDPASVGADSLRVTQGGAPVAGTTRYRGDYLEFLPDEPLATGLAYAVSLDATLLDLAGLPLAAAHSWDFSTDGRTPVGAWSQTTRDQAPTAMSGATAVWTGTEVLIWGMLDAGRYDPAADQWLPSAISVGGPAPRIDHSAVWTGTAMVIWGGRSSRLPGFEILAGGGAYDPASDTWTAIVPPASSSSFATYDHAAAWTGTEMIAWGGARASGPVNSGWRYDPAAGTAVAFTGTNPPAARSQASAAWTGSELIVWGGVDAAGEPLADGARYNPVADAWTPLPPISADFVPALTSSAVWTGNELIVWNGSRTEPDQTVNDRQRAATLHFYDPVADSWRRSTSGWEPFLAGANPFVVSNSGNGYFALWTGDRMFVAGRYPGDRTYLYDPNLDRWQQASDPPGLGIGRRSAATVWAGSRFMIWGGVINSLPPGDDGLLFQP